MQLDGRHLDADHAARLDDSPVALAQVQTPVLLLGAERDRLVEPRAIREAAARLPAAELLMFKGARHEILRETDDVRLEAQARIDAFLDARVSTNLLDRVGPAAFVGS